MNGGAMGTRRSGGRTGTIAIVYDGDCGFCTATARVIARLDILGRVELFDFHREWDAIAARCPALTPEACATAVHAIERDGRVSQGFVAFRRLLWYVPAGWVLLPLLYLPGVRRAGERVYAWVAARRARTSCALTPLTM